MMHLSNGSVRISDDTGLYTVAYQHVLTMGTRLRLSRGRVRVDHVRVCVTHVRFHFSCLINLSISPGTNCKYVPHVWFICPGSFLAWQA